MASPTTAATGSHERQAPRQPRVRLFGPAPPEEVAGVAAPGDEEDQDPPPLAPELEEQLLTNIEAVAGPPRSKP